MPNETVKLEISQLDILKLSPEDWKWTNLSQHYLMKLFQKANEAGLAGRKIVEVRGYEMMDRPDIRYIDFICQPVETPDA